MKKGRKKSKFNVSCYEFDLLSHCGFKKYFLLNIILFDISTPYDLLSIEP